MTKNFDEIFKRIFLKLSSKQMVGLELYKILDDESFYENLHDSAMKIIPRLFRNVTTKNERHTVMLSLIVIGLKNYDGAYWQYVNQTYSNLYDRGVYSQGKVEYLLREFIKKYDSGFMKEGRRYISIPLCYGLVPEHYLFDFYNIMLEIYVNDLRGELPVHETDMINFLDSVFSQVAHMNIGKEESFTSSVSNQSYKLIYSTRLLMGDARHRYSLVQLGNNILRSIHAFMTEDSDYVKEDFLVNYTTEWFERQGQYRHRSLIRSVSASRKKAIKWRPEIVFDNLSQLFLITKTIFLPADIDYEKIKVEVYSNDELVYSCDKPEIIDNGLSLELTSQDIPITWNPFNYVYKIEGYDRNDQDFFYEHMFFDSSGKQLVNNYHNREELYFLCPSKKTVNYVDVLEKTKHYTLSYVDGTSDIIAVDDEFISLTKLDKPYISGHRYNNVWAKVYGHNYSIYYDKLHLVIPINKRTKKIITHNNGRVINHEFDDSTDNLILELDNVKYGVNTLETIVIQENEEQSDKFTYLYDDSLNYHFDEQHSQLRVESKLCNGVNENNVITLENDNVNKCEIECDDGFIKYSLCVLFENPLYSIFEGVWEKIPKYFWHENFKNYQNIEITGIFADTLKIININDDELINQIESKVIGNVTSFNFDIGANLKLANSKTNYLLEFYKGDDIVYTTMFLNHIELDGDMNVEFIETDNELLVSLPGFLGEASIEVCLYEEGKYVCSGEITRDRLHTTFAGLNSFIDYEIVLFDSKKEKELDNRHIYISSIRNLVGQDFLLSSIYLDVTRKINGKYTTKNFFKKVWNHYIHIDKYDKGDGSLVGKLYIDKKNRIEKFYNVGEVKVVFHEELISSKDIMIDLNTMEGESLFYNIDKNKILDSDNEPSFCNFGTIYEVVVSVKSNEEVNINE